MTSGSDIQFWIDKDLVITSVAGDDGPVTNQESVETVRDPWASNESRERRDGSRPLGRVNSVSRRFDTPRRVNSSFSLYVAGGGSSIKTAGGGKHRSHREANSRANGKPGNLPHFYGLFTR